MFKKNIHILTIKNSLIILFLMGMATLLSAQVAPPNDADAFEKAYQKRIEKEYLFGVYIPKDLTDAFIQLNQLIDDESKTVFKNRSEAEAVRKLHFSFGRWMIYNWQFYEGSRFSEYLRGLGIYNPDDMATFVMLSYHRNLNRTPLKVKEQIEQIQEKRRRIQQKRVEEGALLHQEKRTRTPDGQE